MPVCNGARTWIPFNKRRGKIKRPKRSGHSWPSPTEPVGRSGVSCSYAVIKTHYFHFLRRERRWLVCWSVTTWQCECSLWTTVGPTWLLRWVMLRGNRLSPCCSGSNWGQLFRSWHVRQFIARCKHTWTQSVLQLARLSAVVYYGINCRSYGVSDWVTP
jgi:hypothetical protein